MRQFFRESIIPVQQAVLTDGVQKMSVYAKRVHRYENRSGALETSVTHETAKIEGDRITAAVAAGGPARARWAYDVTYLRQTGRRRRNIRDGRAVSAGSRVNVHYAKYVEGRGFNVLIHAVRKFVPQLSRRLRQPLSIVRLSKA